MSSLHVAVIAFSSHGGSGIVGFESACRLAHRGHRVCFISSERPLRADPAEGALSVLTVQDDPFPEFSPNAYTWSLAASLLDVHQRQPIDVVHAHYALPHAVSLGLVRQTLGTSTPHLVTTLHGTDVTHYTERSSHRRLTAWALQQCDALVVPSSALRRSAAEHFGFASERFRVIGNFVDLEAFQPNLERRTPQLVHVSNLRAVKRGLDVIAVFARCHDAVPGLRLVVVGDGPDRVAMESRARVLGLSDHVEFAGVDPDVASRLREASVFLLPSESESFGLAALEAMACGLPVVGSRVGGLQEVVPHGQGGFLFPVGDVEAMARAALELLCDPALLKRQATAARSRAEQIGAPDPIIDEYEALYRSLSVSV